MSRGFSKLFEKDFQPFPARFLRTLLAPVPEVLRIIPYSHHSCQGGFSTFLDFLKLCCFKCLIVMYLVYSIHIVNLIAPSPRPPSPPGKGENLYSFARGLRPLASPPITPDTSCADRMKDNAGRICRDAPSPLGKRTAVPGVKKLLSPPFPGGKGGEPIFFRKGPAAPRSPAHYAGHQPC